MYQPLENNFDAEWTSKPPSNPLEWEQFPPQEDKARLEAWKHYNNLFRGRHALVFEETPDGTHRLEIEKVQDVLREQLDGYYKPYIVVNFCKLLSRTFSALLFGEGIKVSPKDGNEQTQQTIDKIIQNNGLEELNIKQARTASVQGYTFYHVRWGIKPGWDKPGVIIEAIPGYNVYPISSDDDVTSAKGYVVARIIRRGNDSYLLKTIHETGKVTNRFYIMHGSRIGDEIENLPGFENLETEWRHTYPGQFVIPVINNGAIDEFWGISDYEDIESIQDEINNRISKISEILDKHASPILAAPPGVLDQEGADGRPYVARQNLDIIEVTAPTDVGDLPKYITWDASLEAAYREFEMLQDQLMIASQFSPSILGGVRGYAAAESAKALKLRMVQTMAIVNEKRMSFDRALRDVIYAALWLEHQFGGGPKPVPVSIEWGDGLPEDLMETAQVHTMMVNGKIESIETAVNAVHGFETDKLAKEVAAIKNETMEYIPAFDNPGDIDA